MRAKRPLSLASRVSAVTNSFVQGLLPDAIPSANETTAALAVLGQTLEELRCVYCGGTATDIDHLRPLVRGRRPTGYLNDSKNRVPACSTCNNSKGGQEWRAWMRGNAAKGLKRRGFSDEDIEEHITILERFESWGAPEAVDFEKIVGADRWKHYWDRLAEIESLMRDAQAEAEIMRADIVAAIEERR